MSIILTCNVTGKTVKWTNQKIIDQKIAEYGSLEAFKAAYVSRGAGKKDKKKDGDGGVGIMKSLMMEGSKMSPTSMSNQQYISFYQQKIDQLIATGAPKKEIDWMKQRLERWQAVA